MKYKIGDIIKLRNDLIAGDLYDGVVFSEDMEYLKNKAINIEDCSKDGIGEWYRVDKLWDITEAMIEGLWVECESCQQVKESDEQPVTDDAEEVQQVTGKLKLLDIFNMMAKDELKEGTVVIFEDIELTYKNGDLEDEDGYSIACIINTSKDLFTEVDLIEPTIEPISAVKIEKLGLEWMLYQSSGVAMCELVKKINEIVNYINEVDKNEQSTQ